MTPTLDLMAFTPVNLDFYIELFGPAVGLALALLALVLPKGLRTPLCVVVVASAIVVLFLGPGTVGSLLALGSGGASLALLVMVPRDRRKGLQRLARRGQLEMTETARGLGVSGQIDEVPVEVELERSKVPRTHLKVGGCGDMAGVRSISRRLSESIRLLSRRRLFGPEGAMTALGPHGVRFVEAELAHLRANLTPEGVLVAHHSGHLSENELDGAVQRLVTLHKLVTRGGRTVAARLFYNFKMGARVERLANLKQLIAGFPHAGETTAAIELGMRAYQPGEVRVEAARGAIASGFGTLREPAYFVLVETFQNANISQRVRGDSLTTLTDLFGSGRARPLLRDAVQSDHPAVVEAGIRGLGRLGAASGAALLTTLVEAAERMNISRCWWALLGSLEATNAAPPLLERVASGLLENANSELRRRGVDLLLNSGTVDATELLVAHSKRRLGRAEATAVRRALLVISKNGRHVAGGLSLEAGEMTGHLAVAPDPEGAVSLDRSHLNEHVASLPS